MERALLTLTQDGLLGEGIAVQPPDVEMIHCSGDSLPTVLVRGERFVVGASLERLMAFMSSKGRVLEVRWEFERSSGNVGNRSPYAFPYGIPVSI